MRESEEMGSESWNVLATAKDREQRRLAHRLKRFGDLRWTPFRGLLIGRVEDHHAFFEQLLRQEEDEPAFLSPIAKIVPIDRTFDFTVENFTARLKEAVLPYAGHIGNGSFYVRLERRGHAGEIHSQQVEQEMARVLYEVLSAQGKTPSVTFKDPDVIVVVETVGDVCGVGVITRDMRTRFPFVRVP
ncbi:MAG: hypothetical protein C4293_22440 [Nitrospiraceae bacterium]